jgi:hypothetical protein
MYLVIRRIPNVLIKGLSKYINAFFKELSTTSEYEPVFGSYLRAIFSAQSLQGNAMPIDTAGSEDK